MRWSPARLNPYARSSSISLPTAGLLVPDGGTSGRRRAAHRAFGYRLPAFALGLRAGHDLHHRHKDGPFLFLLPISCPTGRKLSGKMRQHFSWSRAMPCRGLPRRCAGRRKANFSSTPEALEACHCRVCHGAGTLRRRKQRT